MSEVFALEGDEFDDLVASMQSYGEGAGQLITEVIHASGDEIYHQIDPLINPSGRVFKGHTSGARGTAWQKYDTSEALAITVKTASKRNYLYFPDDGSNTRRHFGNQQFMYRGVEAAAPAILERALDALITEFERS